MFKHLQISDRRERWAVGTADALLSVMRSPARLLGSLPRSVTPRRILLLRLEQMGDLLMTLPAIAAVRDLAPGARVDLIVGSWNLPIAHLLPGITSVEPLDAPWLARGRRNPHALNLLRRALAWRSRGYDLAINFEGDIRSHLLMRLSGAHRRVGFGMAGGGPTLTDRVTFDPGAHVAVNALRLVSAAFDATDDPLEGRYLTSGTSPARARLHIPDTAHRAAASWIGTARLPLIGIHAGGGRPIKQWPAERFGEVARRISEELDGTIVLTGTAADRPLVDQVKVAVPRTARVVDLAGQIDLVTLGAVLQRLSCLITGDTGPMHLADALGTKVVAVFGLTDPARYRPLSPDSRSVRIDLACSPCNRVRRPPARCSGHTPDCLDGIDAARVYDAVQAVLTSALSVRGRSIHPIAVQES